MTTRQAQFFVYIVVAVLAAACTILALTSHELENNQAATLKQLEETQLKFAAADLANTLNAVYENRGRYPVSFDEEMPDDQYSWERSHVLGIKSLRLKWGRWVHINPAPVYGYPSYITYHGTEDRAWIEAYANNRVVYAVAFDHHEHK